MNPEGALARLGQELQKSGYHFITVTPKTHQRVAQRLQQATCLRDIFGWSLPFERAVLSPALWELAWAAQVLKPEGDRWRSRVRFSTLGADLLVHSAFPTEASDAVFFGPDTYRFASLLRSRARPARRCVDVGCGSGAGALSVRDRMGQLVLADVNPAALRLASVNARLARAEHVELCESNILQGVRDPFDLVIANPPYIVDSLERAYRHGGGAHGVDIALRMVREALARLPSGGQLLLYTGTPVCAGNDVFRAAVEPVLQTRPVSFVYGEIDPDVFGEELERPAYASAERIAVVFLDVTID